MLEPATRLELVACCLQVRWYTLRRPRLARQIPHQDAANTMQTAANHAQLSRAMRDGNGERNGEGMMATIDVSWDQYRRERSSRNGVYSQACARSVDALRAYHRVQNETTRGALFKALSEVDEAYARLVEIDNWRPTFD